jgi:hypothetical protein
VDISETEELVIVIEEFPWGAVDEILDPVCDTGQMVVYV